MTISLRNLLGVAGIVATAASASPASAMEGVVASIKPVHSLVAGVMEGVGEPGLLVSGAGSPHTYSMRPSEAQMLQGARVVFWIGADLETFLVRPLETLAPGATVIELSEAHDLVRLGYREGGPFETHAHDDEHDHHDHDHDHSQHDHDHDHSQHDHDHAHADEHEHHEAEGHDHAQGGHGHAHAPYDMHFWLDPVNAKAFVQEIEEALSAADPGNAAAYSANAEVLRQRLDDLLAETEAALSAVQGRPFVVFHDAYQYYEQRFGLEAAGSITVNPEIMPGVQRLGEIQNRIRGLGAACVFAEPQFEPRLVEVAIEGTGARAGVLDPLGAELEDGPELYFQLVTGLTRDLVACLGEAS